MGRQLGATTTAILSALAGGARYGLDITRRAGLLPGTVYTTLRRLEKRDLVRSHWEDPAVAEAERRPRRRYYELSNDGHRALTDATAHYASLAASLEVRIPGGEKAES